MIRRKRNTGAPLPGRYHSHVVLRTDSDGTHRLIIDGMDVSNTVLSKNLKLYLDDNDGKALPELQLDVTFAVDQVDADIRATVTATPEKKDKAS